MEEKLEDIVVGVAEDKIPKEQLEVIFKDLVQQKHQNNTPAHIYKR